MKDSAVFRPLTVLIALAASATLAGCGTTAHSPTFTRTADGWHFTQTPELVLPQDDDGIIEN